MSAALIDLLRVIAPSGPWTARTIYALEPEAAPKTPRKLGFTVEPENADDPDNGILGWVRAAAAGQNNCYIHATLAKPGAANKPKLAKADVAGSRCVWSDVDPNPQKYDESRTAILAAMQAEDPPFSCIVDSGNGFQGYKFIEQFAIKNNDDIDKLEAANRAINESLNARLRDVGVKADSCHSVEHLMRAPGTTNFMTAKKRDKGYPEGDRPARIVEWHPERLYRLEDLPQVAAVAPAAPGQATDDDSAPSISSLDDPQLVAVSPEVMSIIRTGMRADAAVDMKAGHVHFKIVAELVRAGLSDANVKAVYRLSLLGVAVAGSSRGFDGYMNKLIAAVHKLAADPKLFEMNEKHCVLSMNGKTRVATWGDDPDFPGRQTITAFSSFTDFKALHDKYRHTYQVNGEPKTVRLGSWWISNPHRQQYDGGMRFMPDRDEDVVGDVLNLWQGFAVPARKPEGKSGAAGCNLLLDHGLNIICSGNEEHYDYLIKREAFIAQKRARSEIAVALKTKKEGTGKGFWCRSFNRLYGVHAMEVNNPDHVVGKHNAHLEKLLRLTADEALFALDPRHRNALYNLITEPHLTIEPKFIGVYQANNHINIDVISNADHFIPVSGTARRFFVPPVSSDRANDHEYFGKIAAQLHDGGYEALLHHLLHEVDIRDFNVRAVPKTAALEEQKAYSRKGVDLLVEKVCNEARVPCQYYSDYPEFSRGNDYWDHGFDAYISRNADRELSRMGALAVKRKLRDEWECTTGKPSRKIVDGKRESGVWWPPLTKLRALFVAKFGEQAWLCPKDRKWRTD